MQTKFYVCPWCGYKRDEGFTGIELRYDLAEIRLSAEGVVEHRHVGVPDIASSLNLRLHKTLDNRTNCE